MTAAQTLIEARRRSRLGLRELARRAGTSHATLHAYETGTKEPRLDTVVRIVAAAGFSLEVALAPRPDAGDGRAEKGRELESVLDLAGEFPARHARHLGAPDLRAAGMTISLAQKVVAIHRALRDAGVPHAFGGALALAWCTERARGTVDIDVNLFLEPTEVGVALGAPPAAVVWSNDDVALLERDGQARLRWDSTPIDLFFNTTDFHVAAAGRTRTEPFLGENVPFLACRDLAVFKAFFNRTRDWADLEDMAAAGALDADAVLGVLVRYLGGDDERVSRLRSLTAP